MCEMTSGNLPCNTANPALVLCDDLEGQDWESGGREPQEGGGMILDVVEQKPTQHCKAIIFQLK